MKTLFALITASLLVISADVLAQVTAAPSSQGTTRQYWYTTGKAYEASQGDSTFAIFKLGGVRAASVTLTVSDTLNAAIRIDWRRIGATLWNTAIVDSIGTGDVTTTTRRELILRGQSPSGTWVDYLGGYDVEVRPRVTFYSAGNGITGGTYSLKLTYVP